MCGICGIVLCFTFVVDIAVVVVVVVVVVVKVVAVRMHIQPRVAIARAPLSHG